MNWLSKDTPPASTKPPQEGETPDGEKLTIVCNENDPLAAFVFKTIADPFVGRISLFRVYAGVMKSNSTVYNAVKEKDERLGGLFYMVG